MGCRVWVKDHNLYVVKGNADSYPCLVAHTDTVFDFIPQAHLEVFCYRDMILGHNTERDTYTGLGMDDKIGIWIALKMLEQQDYLKCFFPHAEEAGAIGSRKADMSFFEDVSFCIQCDRKGNSDIVTNIYGTTICSDEFFNEIKPLVKKYGYDESEGLLTDVFQLVKNGIGKSCVNLSTGYYNPHQMDEYAIVPDVMNTLHFVSEILDTCKFKTYPLPILPPRRYESYYNRWNSGHLNTSARCHDHEDFFDYQCGNCLACGQYREIVDEFWMLCRTCYETYHAEIFAYQQRKHIRSQQNNRKAGQEEPW